MVKELINSLMFGFGLIFKILTGIGIPIFIGGISIGGSIKNHQHKSYIETGCWIMLTIFCILAMIYYMF